MMVMCVREASTVQKLTHHFLEGLAGEHFDPLNPTHVRTLAEYLDSRLGSLFAKDELIVTGLICALGPKIPSSPPADLRAGLLELARLHLAERSDFIARIGELAVAYGVGQWRTVASGPWHERWDRAMSPLNRVVWSAVVEADQWLLDHVIGFRELRGHRRNPEAAYEDELVSDCGMLISQLLDPEYMIKIGDHEEIMIHADHGETWITFPDESLNQRVPAGSKYVFTVLDALMLDLPPGYLSLEKGTKVIITARDHGALISLPRKVAIPGGGTRREFSLEAGQTVPATGTGSLAIWSCTCGNRKCRDRHRIGSWAPDLYVPCKVAPGGRQPLSLVSYIASAVKGPIPIRAGSFAQSLYFQLLARHGCAQGRLRLVWVEVKRCGTCRADSAPYEGESCPLEARCFDPSRDRRDLARRIILVDCDPEPYLPVARLRCPVCRNLYPLPSHWPASVPPECRAILKGTRELGRSSRRLAEMARVYQVDKVELEARLKQQLDDLRCPLCGARAPTGVTTVWEQQRTCMHQLNNQII